jgi:hypothetical protein
LKRQFAERQGDVDETKLAAVIRRDSVLVKLRWIRAGILVRSSTLALAWSVERRSLQMLCKRGELLSLRFGHRHWYPKEFGTLPFDDVKAVCVALRPLDASSQFLFWHRKHGALAGKTLHAALRDGHRAGVLHSARSFVAEHAPESEHDASQVSTHTHRKRPK